MIEPTNNWQVMTPLARTGYRMVPEYVKWTVSALHAHDAARIAEQVAGELGVVFDGDIHLRRLAPVVVTTPDALQGIPVPRRSGVGAGGVRPSSRKPSV